MVNKVPVPFTNFGFGATFTTRGQSFSHMFTIDFQTRADLETYSLHPVHVGFVNETIKPNVAAVNGAPTLAMDIEI
ncbi:hypothetical protein HDV03_003795 [Kappamyces sp. JEL0829]|nr:hypothetical protein HDV03_003795 [Kappamyces sp. JEL0829]